MKDSFIDTCYHSSLILAGVEGNQLNFYDKSLIAYVKEHAGQRFGGKSENVRLLFQSSFH